MKLSTAQDILQDGNKANPRAIEIAYRTVFNTDIKTRLLVLVADYSDPSSVNTEFDQYGWQPMSLIKHLYGSQ